LEVPGDDGCPDRARTVPRCIRVFVDIERPQALIDELPQGHGVPQDSIRARREASTDPIRGGQRGRDPIRTGRGPGLPLLQVPKLGRVFGIHIIVAESPLGVTSFLRHDNHQLARGISIDEPVRDALDGLKGRGDALSVRGLAE
jgi:hypothetical protein